jgi:hypothetical protein
MERRLLWLNVGVKALLVGLPLPVVLPFVIDTGGNVLDLYSLWWFDDVAHFLNWWILVSAFALALQRTRLGLGAATEILWELGEYGVMKLGSAGLQLTYKDTIGDLALGGRDAPRRDARRTRRQTRRRSRRCASRVSGNEMQKNAASSAV